jgi:hypothetical protein
MADAIRDGLLRYRIDGDSGKPIRHCAFRLGGDAV